MTATAELVPRIARDTLDGGWLVGGAVRDRLLGRPTGDLDLAVPGDVEAAARALARAAGGFVFPLSEAFGAWRVAARDGTWQADLAPLAGATIEDDLAQRDFTVNAMAAPLASLDDVVDPYGGRDDLALRKLTLVGEAALDADPLRLLRGPRIAGELGFELDQDAARAIRARARRAAEPSPERIFAELVRIVGADDPVSGVRRLDGLGLLGVVLPELVALEGVGQGVYHHLDVYEHTLAVLAEAVTLESGTAPALGRHAERVAARLAEPLADGLSRAGGLRWAALLHDAAKPETRRVFPGRARVGFPGHDRAGAELARDVLGRLRASERLKAHVAALTRHHLRLGFLVHERPLPPRRVHEYLRATAPVTVDVTVLTVADRLATRGRKAEPAIAAHLELAGEILDAAWADEERAGEPPVVRGDALAAALGRAPGPWLSGVLSELDAARYAGEIATEAEAIDHARAWLARQNA